MQQLPIFIGISACLTGQKVRFDAGHKRSAFCMEQLEPYVQYRAFCPEVAIGLPTPRPAIRQVKVGERIEVQQNDGTGDVYGELHDYGNKIAAQQRDLSGFIFCAKSPSCGTERVKVYHQQGQPADYDGIGIFAKAIMENQPNLPVEDSGRLIDAQLRENFVLRVFTYNKWLNLLSSGLTKHKLITFHSQHKYLLMSHDPVAYKTIGKLLGESKQALDELQQSYISMLMAALKKVASRKNHVNTLHHLQGYFQRNLDAKQKRELTEKIHDYRLGLSPLLVPLTLINHYLSEFPNPYLASQVYLAPYPKELPLRYSF
ncbi:YbgA family protein [Paraglaciecola hydrolytica]|uniref:DUF1722 domain-containing protein n=1 Tax=Paraglaciecola hydrolytica TaxID=1799789 RepID=A0A136A3Y0_9ALTE|nr:DUF523 and DUF1722 domain-containing protein [Paraglaciecola hydrolytica]KXI29929.1 hypothetical protein AX660_07880 [Paraglaciecola hydrolytica]